MMNTNLFANIVGSRIRAESFLCEAPPPFEEENGDERLNRNRERNREHARKTRKRKKEQLQALQTRISELEEENRRLRQKVEECSVASILIGLSSGNTADGGQMLESIASSSLKNFGETLASGKRKRFLSLDGADVPPPMELKIRGQTTLVGGSGNEGKAQINWKTGVYCDENGLRQQLTSSELEALRRERNRMHAKMTRDRKKCFVASVKRVISKLEDENQRLKVVLNEAEALPSEGDVNTVSGFGGAKQTPRTAEHIGLQETKTLSIENTVSVITDAIADSSSVTESSLYTVG